MRSGGKAHVGFVTCSILSGFIFVAVLRFEREFKEVASGSPLKEGRMSFQESSDTLRAKLHLSKMPVSKVAVLGVSVVAVLLLAVGASRVFASGDSESFSFSGDESQNSDISELNGGGQDAPSGSSVEPEPTVVVHVSGEVVNPGVYRVVEGSRVDDAIELAGGFTENAVQDSLNLARVIADGEQIIVSSVEDSQSPDSVARGSAAGGKVNINTASLEELDELPGVGESTAQKIIDDREQNGPFLSCEDLKRVSGIGDKKYEELSELISVG